MCLGQEISGSQEPEKVTHENHAVKVSVSLHDYQNARDDAYGEMPTTEGLAELRLPLIQP